MENEGDQLAQKLGKVIIERDWAVGKLGSLDLLTKKTLLDRSEDNQATEIKNMPSLNNQIKMLNISKSTIYYESVHRFSRPSEIQLLNTIDKIYTKFPYYGHRHFIRRKKPLLPIKNIKNILIF